MCFVNPVNSNKTNELQMLVSFSVDFRILQVKPLSYVWISWWGYEIREVIKWKALKSSCRDLIRKKFTSDFQFWMSTSWCHRHWDIEKKERAFPLVSQTCWNIEKSNKKAGVPMSHWYPRRRWLVPLVLFEGDFLTNTPKEIHYFASRRIEYWSWGNAFSQWRQN